MKKHFRLLIVTLLIASISCGQIMMVNASSLKAEREKYLLELNEKETIDFLIDLGVRFPELPSDYYYWGEFAKRVVTVIKDYPDYEFAINSPDTLKLAES